LIPYSSFIGAQAKVEGDNVRYWLDRRPSNIGNPSLPAIHGGVIGGFLELSAAIEILYTLDVELFPKVVDFSLDYLRPGRYKTIYANCTVLRQGKKLVNVTATAWQDNPETPISTARCHFLIAK
jgi:acyl-coenzyme A thioesterase PaaI-like protein